MLNNLSETDYDCVHRHLCPNQDKALRLSKALSLEESIEKEQIRDLKFGMSQ
jgi:hypothetical protein